MEGKRRWICFEEPDGAYLAAAALRRYGDGTIDAILIPTERGPTIDIASDALDDALVRALAWRFGGRIEDAQAAVVQDATSGPGLGLRGSEDESPGASQRLRSSLM